ncbi:MAG: nucleotidyl transferase AbiEii/AbiGii toxin family protein [Lachnospiraceae bacterium]|nr:nucleotidyl transferase AbiEii/AbiGii toxin family protein [Lachnospiraceae bacterium]
MNTASVKAKLKNYAINTGITFQEALTYYGLERTIYRISISKYADRFILKGGIFLYAIFDGRYERATTDIDLLARRINNSSDEMKAIFHDILLQEADDALIFDLGSIAVENIAELKEYHGLNVSVTAYLDRTRIPVSIDIGFGDVIHPNAIKMDFPIMLDMDVPRINAYSLESAVAEKLEAIIHNGYLNSRYKDFYDLYILSDKYSFSYKELRSAVVETFENRNTSMTLDTAAFTDEFINDPVHQSRWKAFLKKKKALIDVSLEDTIFRIKTFSAPLFTDAEFTKWAPNTGLWESVTSGNKIDKMIDEIEDYYDLKWAEDRAKDDNGTRFSMREMAEKFNITEEELEAIPDVEID